MIGPNAIENLKLKPSSSSKSTTLLPGKNINKKDFVLLSSQNQKYACSL